MSGESELSDKKAPGFWFYTADFERDTQILSMGAQGLWIRMLCWMSDNEAHRGFAELPTGEPMDNMDIAARVGKPAKEVIAALSEMRRVGTFSEDERGCVFCRRMARDTHISTVRKAAAKSRAEKANRASNGSFAGAKQPAKLKQNPTVPDSDSDSDSVKKEPPTPADSLIGESAERMYCLHPKKKNLALVPGALQSAAKGPVPLSDIEACHAAWCKTEDWTKNGGRFAPTGSVDCGQGLHSMAGGPHAYTIRCALGAAWHQNSSVRPL